MDHILVRLAYKLRSLLQTVACISKISANNSGTPGSIGSPTECIFMSTGIGVEGLYLAIEGYSWGLCLGLGLL
jgi:hypothetical protein